MLSAFSNIFSSETIGPIEAKFHVEPPWDGGTKVYSNSPGHMTKVAAMHICGKSLKSSPEPKAYNLETWYVALGARVLPSLFKMMTLG